MGDFVTQPHVSDSSSKISRRIKNKKEILKSQIAVYKKVTLPLAMAPVTQEDDMRWNPNDDGIVFNP